MAAVIVRPHGSSCDFIYTGTYIRVHCRPVVASAFSPEGGPYIIMHGRSLSSPTRDPRISTMPGRGTSGMLSARQASLGTEGTRCCGVFGESVAWGRLNPMEPGVGRIRGLWAFFLAKGGPNDLETFSGETQYQRHDAGTCYTAAS